MSKLSDHIFVMEARNPFVEDYLNGDPFFDPDHGRSPSGRAGGASHLSRCASQPKALIPNAERNH